MIGPLTGPAGRVVVGAAVTGLLDAGAPLGLPGAAAPPDDVGVAGHRRSTWSRQSP
jgi:hypothetical protein